MTELRRRMDDDMLARGLADRTRESYLWAVTGLARFYRRSPDQISDEEIQAYLVHLIRDRQHSWSTCNIVVNGLRFFYHTTLKRDRTTFAIPSPRQSGKLPVVLSREEVQRLMTHATTQKHRTMLMTAYAAGLRLSEVLHLRGVPYRFRTDDDSGGPRKGRQRSGHASSPRGCSRRCARTGKSRGPPRLVVSRPRPRVRPVRWIGRGSQKAYQDGQAARGPDEARRHSHAAPLLRDASARRWRRSAHDSALAGSRPSQRPPRGTCS